MKKLILILFIICSGCYFTDEVHYSVDPELRPIIESFHLEAKKRGFDYTGVDLIVRFKDISSAGKTELKSIPIVDIDPDYFKERSNGTEYQRLCLEMVVFHELGHALFSPEHVEGDEDLMSEFMPMSAYANNPEERIKILDRFFK